MNLLIITQKVDCDDPILGFFHRWIEEFARHCDRVTVIAQSVGSYAFPHTVTVHTLGKERGRYCLFQLLWFHWLQWKLRRDYGVVFVHMTPLWIFFGWKIWFLLRKPIYLWYEARGTRWPLRFALLVVRKVFSASSYGMPLRTRKNVITGHGIDVPPPPCGVQRREPLLVTVGRITASKRLPLLLQAFATLPCSYRFRIAGVPITRADGALLGELYSSLQQAGIEDRVEIQQASREEVWDLLARATVFIHASATSLDKAMLEAMAHSCLVVSCAEAAQDLLPRECMATPETMAGALQHLLSLPMERQEELRQELRAIVERGHSLQRLILRLVTEMQ